MHRVHRGGGIGEADADAERAGHRNVQHVHPEGFEFVFLRRFIMYAKSKAWIFYPGGIGTLDELSECMQLRYTGIRNQKPIICVDQKYWEGLFTWLEERAFKNNYLMHGKSDLQLVQFAETTEDILKIVEQA